MLLIFSSTLEDVARDVFVAHGYRVDTVGRIWLGLDSAFWVFSDWGLDEPPSDQKYYCARDPAKENGAPLWKEMSISLDSALK